MGSEHGLSYEERPMLYWGGACSYCSMRGEGRMAGQSRVRNAYRRIDSGITTRVSLWMMRGFVGGKVQWRMEMDSAVGYR